MFVCQGSLTSNEKNIIKKREQAVSLLRYQSNTEFVLKRPIYGALLSFIEMFRPLGGTEAVFNLRKANKEMLGGFNFVAVGLFCADGSQSWCLKLKTTRHVSNVTLIEKITVCI